MARYDPLLAWFRRRLRLVATAGAVGIVLGGIAAVVIAVLDDPTTASTQTFAIGTLAFGFGILGWSGSALAGRSIEGLQRRLDTNSDWTERDSRRAMTRLSGFGAGVMAGVVIVTPLLP
ncbi:hypothetical protein C448_03706 [Halococcus morrhuae DSM 1307]|uniref:Uncharacterized protein n=1 Tax=Halococcus morrhuae DSM 1307 TaxID=931277 RepID=M0MV87_HALMO|nr:hypothetical protein [Halococcus morrhuae]EMA48350.1 hypothetical protein C448_03706 [Halococcus morrhuae DSM 1307]